ncbi:MULTISPECIES: C-terminal helicase domain-containing protein [Eubacteriales]|uniref:helicase-related protein n=1 Tax=Eubacteriales TaxID=186802 RepID=UPI001D07B56E|nr:MULTISPECIES: C-terminal helicase domain-containing protein [Eubacteriales]MCB7039885.1 SWF/SNF helicase family protein [Flavonifractor plautii]MCB7049770.1 SWF/SNF helicase family protein [Intestinimonas butyriciproducens]
MSPSHVTRKWVREIGETLPNTYGMVVRSITDLDRLYQLYEQGDKSVFAVFSKEKARDGYMRYPAVTWNRRRKGFLCPDCMEPVQMEVSEDGTSYRTNADQFFFQTEHKKNHKCPNCGSVLWAPVNPGRQIPWVKIGEYGWVYRYGASAHLARTKNEAVTDQLMKIAEHPDGYYPVKGARRRYPLSTYIKKKMRGRIDSFLADELHEYNNASGQGDAMAELYGASKLFVGMTATLINGYSSGIFHLLYRIVPGLMRKDGKSYRKPGDFDAEYGVVENVYEIRDGDYNSNRRTTKRKTKTRQLPGVSPLVFSRFLLEYTAFLSLTDMGKDLPDYEEIPVAIEMPEDVRSAYKEAEHTLQSVLKSDRQAAQKILSAYLNLLTVYPDQPYDQPTVIHPITGLPLVVPENLGDFERILPKEEETMAIVRRKIAAGERVLIYTSWTRTDSQRKLLKLLREEGYRSEILTPNVPTEKREEWVEKRVKSGLQVLITNPRVVETGLDLNAFTTLIFYSMGYNLFTLRQASRRSWRINQTAPRVEVYMLYYANTMQAKAMKLMASKLAVAGIIEGTFSEEGLAAMSDVKDMTSQMAKELAQGIKDNVEDIASAFKKMAIINPERRRVKVEQAVAEEAPEQAPITTVQPAEGFGVRAVQSQKQQVLYDGLLDRTIEERKKKKSKKTVVDENQLSIFDFVA